MPKILIKFCTQVTATFTEYLLVILLKGCKKFQYKKVSVNVQRSWNSAVDNGL